MARHNAFVFLLVAMMASAVFAYQSRFDRIDVDSIISNKRILTSFLKCFMDEGPCTGEAKDMKEVLPEVVQTKCANCSDVQKKLMAKAINFLMSERPDDWKKLVDKYDPNHVHEGDLKHFLDEVSKL